jgi:allantoate deiminase
LTGAAEWITAVEQVARSVEGLVATVGVLEALPGAANVIAGEARGTLDIRHANDAIRKINTERLLYEADKIAVSRNLAIEYSIRMNQRAVRMDTRLLEFTKKAFVSVGVEPHQMVSGAGHDAMIIAEQIPAAMIFLRSPRGTSHHPEESVRVEDVETALGVGAAFLDQLSTYEFQQE